MPKYNDKVPDETEFLPEYKFNAAKTNMAATIQVATKPPQTMMSRIALCAV